MSRVGTSGVPPAAGDTGAMATRTVTTAKLNNADESTA